MAVIEDLNRAINPVDLDGKITIQDLKDTIEGSGGEVTSIAWADVTGKPSTFPPATHTHAWGDTTGKPAVIAAGADQAAARTAIGAGTSNLAIGTTATTAAAGNHTHSVATVSAMGFMSAADKTKLDGIATGATALALGSTATTAAAGNHTHSNYATTQALADLIARVEALEAAATP